MADDPINSSKNPYPHCEHEDVEIVARLSHGYIVLFRCKTCGRVFGISGAATNVSEGSDD